MVFKSQLDIVYFRIHIYANVKLVKHESTWNRANSTGCRFFVSSSSNAFRALM